MLDRIKLQEMLGRTTAMWDDPLVYFYQNNQLAPPGFSSIFLAGPSSRQDVMEYKWRKDAVHYLRQAGFRGVIYVPEPRENDWSFKEYFESKIVEWESSRLLSSTLSFFWIPRHETQLPGRVTNTELGFLSGMAMADPDRFKNRMIVGAPHNAWKIKSEKHWAGLAGINFFDDLETMCKHTARKLHEIY